MTDPNEPATPSRQNRTRQEPRGHRVELLGKDEISFSITSTQEQGAPNSSSRVWENFLLTFSRSRVSDRDVGVVSTGTFSLGSCAGEKKLRLADRPRVMYRHARPSARPSTGHR